MRNLKKAMNILLAVTMMIGVLAMAPAAGAAGERVDVAYVSAAGEDMGTRSCIRVTKDVTNWSNGWYAFRYGGLSNNTFYVNGTVNLIICDDCNNFTADAGIILNPGSHLIIWGQSGGRGYLRANGKTDYRPGIGGDATSGDSGNLTINGGKIVAEGGNGAPGLGSCGHDSGVITINGGNITAYGCNGKDNVPGAPGIGASGSGTMNDIYFYGGSLNITGGYNASSRPCLASDRRR